MNQNPYSPKYPLFKQAHRQVIEIRGSRIIGFFGFSCLFNTVMRSLGVSLSGEGNLSASFCLSVLFRALQLYQRLYFTVEATT